MQIDESLIRLIGNSIASAPQLQKLFDLYCERLTSDPDKPFFTESEVLMCVQPGARTTGPQEAPQDPAHARNANGRLRKILQEIRSTALGTKLPYFLEVPHRKYGLSLVPNQPFVKQLWSPYISLESSEQKTTRFVYTEHLFRYHIENRYLLRHMDANTPSEDIRRWLPFVPDSHGPLPATRQFVNSSEVRALLTLTSFFSGCHVPVAYTVAHSGALRSQLLSQNLIILGNTRTSPIIGQLQRELRLNFRLEARRILNLNPLEGEEPFYENHFRTEDRVFGYVARAFSPALRGHVTLIASNHGRFVGALASFLTDEDSVRFLAETISRSPDDHGFPEDFQVLFAVQPPPEEDNAMVGYLVEILALR